MHYENLPVYQKTIEMSVLMENIVKHFSRFHRYELGAEMRKLAREIAVAVVKANFATDKIVAITHLRDKSEEMKLTIMIAKEVKAFKSFKQFQQAVVLAVEVSKQSQGWLNPAGKTSFKAQSGVQGQGLSRSSWVSHARLASSQTAFETGWDALYRDRRTGLFKPQFKAASNDRKIHACR